MKRILLLVVVCGVLACFDSRLEAATGDFQDDFSPPTLKTNWHSAICVSGATYPVDWRLSNGVLRGYWRTHYGQQHLTVEGPAGPCTVQVRCRLDSANHAQSSAILILKAEDPAIRHPGVGANNFYACGIGNGTFIFGRLGTTIPGGYDFPKLESNASLQVGTWHTLKAEINGSHIRCFLDDEMVFETDDTSFTGRYFGVGAALYADVSFDDFQITTPTPPPTVATSRAVATGQFIDTGWPLGTGSQEKVTFMIVAEPASTDPGNPAPAQATVAMDSPAIRKLFGKSLVLQGTPDQYVENPIFTQDPKLPKELHFSSADKAIVVFFNDNGLPGNHPDPTWADWILLSVTDALSGKALLVVTGPLTCGDVMDEVPITTQPAAPTLNVSTVMRVSWPYNLAQSTLEGASTLNGPWEPVNCWVIDQAGEHQVYLPTTSPLKFFRVVESK